LIHEGTKAKAFDYSRVVGWFGLACPFPFKAYDLTLTSVRDAHGSSPFSSFAEKGEESVTGLIILGM
jgi:hypothetical protein